MPTYTYVCGKCGHGLEVVQSMTEAPKRRCPECKAMKLRRTFHPVGIVLKGSGFYKTDNRTSSSNGHKPAAKPETKPEAKSETTSE